MMTVFNFSFNKRYFGAACSIVLLGILLTLFAKNFEISRKPDQQSEPLQFEEVNADSELPALLSEFDPNELSFEQWQTLGFTERQTRTILNYKKMLGGTFSDKEELKKCYGIPEEKYTILEPYILLPEKGQNAEAGRKNFTASEKRTLKVSSKFNPDLYTVQDWINIGFTENQANAILKYRNYLGGSFQSKDKFKACYIISSEKYQKLAPFLLLPEHSAENKFTEHSGKIFPQKAGIKYKIFDPNELDLQGWMQFGFTEKQANTILNYKNKILKGNFRSAEDLANCYVVSAEKFEEMKPYISIKNSQKEGEKPDVSAGFQTSTDFSETDLNQITFRQLKEFGFDDKAAGSFIGFRKKLGGFVTKQQILETYNIDKDLTEKLISTAKLNTDNVPKYTLTEAPENWLREHPYFRYYADKILFYRISYPDDRKILKFLKLKPEAEARMKLYLH